MRKTQNEETAGMTLQFLASACHKVLTRVEIRIHPGVASSAAWSPLCRSLRCPGTRRMSIDPIDRP